MMKRFLAFLFAVFFLATVSAIEPGGLISIEDLVKKAEAVNPPVQTETQPAVKAPYEVIMFFDMTARDSVPYIMMLENLKRNLAELPRNEQAEIFALSRGIRSSVKSLMEQNEITLPVHVDSRRVLFNDYAADELVLPFALIAKEGKVLWKGSPIDLENILNLMRTGKFNPDIQLKVSRLRKEMQMAVQASLPDVILRCANEILKVQPGDSLAIQAKLFVFENSNRFPAALAFTRQNAQANPNDVNQTLLYLTYLQRAGNRTLFAQVLENAVKQFSKSPESLFRLLTFSVNGTVPFSWLPLKSVKALPDMIRNDFNKQSAERRCAFHQYEAAVYYGLCDIDNAVRCQKQALALASQRKKTDVRRQLEFYQNVQRLKQGKAGK